MPGDYFSAKGRNGLQFPTDVVSARYSADPRMKD
jgi:hypothetical protein